MGLYVVLNFEDKYGGVGRGAADSTVKALKYRYEQKKKPKGIQKLYKSNNTVVEHLCVEVHRNAVRFTNDAVRIAQIRADCTSAKKIYVVAHGDPRTTDVCYTNGIEGVGVLRLASYRRLARFLKQVIPARSGTTPIALVMCYGARCGQWQRAQVNHMGHIDSEDLATSFAYRLFKKLVSDRNVKLTAVTGKIQHQADTGKALVEVEDIIDENMEFSEAAKAQTVSKGPLIAQYRQLQAAGKASEINPRTAYYRQHPNSPAVTNVDKYAKSLVAWERDSGLRDSRGGVISGNDVKQRVSDAQQEKRRVVGQLRNAGMETEMPKYGKFIYTYKNDVLKIANKYGRPGDHDMKPMTLLYKGPLL